MIVSVVAQEDCPASTKRRIDLDWRLKTDEEHQSGKEYDPASLAGENWVDFLSAARLSMGMAAGHGAPYAM